MAASASDKASQVANGGIPVSAIVQADRAAGNTTLSLDTVQYWAVATGIKYSTFRKDISTDLPIPGTQQDFAGVISGTTITNIRKTSQGADTGNLQDDIAIMNITAAWGQEFVEAFLLQHKNPTGAHGAVTADTLSVSGAAVINALLTAAAGLTVVGALTLPASSVAPAALATGIDSGKLSNPYKFSAYRNTAFNATASSVTVVFETEKFDTSNNYSTSTGIFTAPVAGFYQFNWQVTSAHASSRWLSILSDLTNTVELARGTDIQVLTSGIASSGGGRLVQLAASQQVSVQIFSDATNAGQAGPSQTYFDGHLVSTT